MLAIRAAESLATGRRSTRWFQGLSAGKTGQFGAAGSGCADTSAGTAISVAVAQTASPARAVASRRNSLRHHGEAVWRHAEGGFRDVADVVAVDLEGEGALV